MGPDTGAAGADGAGTARHHPAGPGPARGDGIHRHRDGNREHRIGRERRNRRWRGRLSALREQNRWDYDNKQTDTNRERHPHSASKMN